MKPNQFSWGWRAVFALFALNLAVVVWSLHAVVTAQEPKRFVYKVINVPGDTQTLQTALTEYGSGGWELVAVAMGDIQVPRLIFKK
jgi:hypothetical protein